MFSAVIPRTNPPAVVALHRDEGEHVWFLNQLVSVKLRGPDVPYGVLETLLAAGEGTPFHRHGDEDETFYVLEGEITLFFEGGQVVRGRPGSFVHVPCGVSHGFRAETALRLLVLSAPRGFVEFTREYGVRVPRPELPPAAAPDLPRLEALARKYQIQILGPLPG